MVPLLERHTTTERMGKNIERINAHFHSAFADTLEDEVARALNPAFAKVGTDNLVSDFDISRERKDNYAPD